MNKRLAAKVKAVNVANATATELYNLLCPIFEKLVGQQIMKKDGSLLAKVEKLLPPLPSSMRLRAYLMGSSYSLAWSISANESADDHSVMYHETTVYVGDHQKGVLVKIATHVPQRTDWTAGEVEAGRKKVEEARKVLDDAKSSIYLFGEIER